MMFNDMLKPSELLQSTALTDPHLCGQPTSFGYPMGTGIVTILCLSPFADANWVSDWTRFSFIRTPSKSIVIPTSDIAAALACSYSLVTELVTGLFEAAQTNCRS